MRKNRRYLHKTSGHTVVCGVVGCQEKPVAKLKTQNSLLIVCATHLEFLLKEPHGESLTMVCGMVDCHKEAVARAESKDSVLYVYVCTTHARAYRELYGECFWVKPFRPQFLSQER